MKQDYLTPIEDLGQNWHDLQIHELCNLFPAMQDEDYSGLVASMRDHGFLSTDPIVLIESDPPKEDLWLILDGRNRHLAAMDAKVEPEFMVYNGENPIGFVTSRNLDRRHLTTGQKAAVAAELAILLNGQNPEDGQVTQMEAAERVGVGEATLRRYKFVEKHDPELAAEVKAGKVPLEKARSTVKKELDEGKSIKDEVDDMTTKSLGDKRAERKAAEKQAITSTLNEAVNELMKKHEIDPSIKKFITEAVLVGYKIGKGE